MSDETTQQDEGVVTTTITTTTTTTIDTVEVDEEGNETVIDTEQTVDVDTKVQVQNEKIPEKEEEETKQNTWESLGSTEEIKALKVKNTRPLIRMSFSRKRSTFGKFVQHTTYDAADSYRFCASYVNNKFSTVKRERDFGSQNVKQQVTQAVQTPRFRKVNKQTQCESIVSTDSEYDATSLASFLKEKEPEMVQMLRQNVGLPLFEDDFANLADEDSFVGSKTTSQLKEHQSFTHMDSKNKKVSCVDWQPNAKGVILFAMVDPSSFEERMEHYGKAENSYVVIWNFADPIYPQMVLRAPCDVLCCRFSPNDNQVVIGGLANGQVIMWDLRDQLDNKKTLRWRYLSLIELSHRAAVNDIAFIQGKEMKNNRLIDSELPKSTNQFMSIGADGRLMIWDTRINNLKSAVKASLRRNEKYKGAWIPYHTMSLNDGAYELAGQSIALDSTIPTGFACTSREGDFIMGDWDSELDHTVANEEEDALDLAPVTNTKKQSIVKNIIRLNSGGHLGVSTSIQRSPFFPKICLTTGDWSFKIWNGNQLLFTSRYATSPYTIGKWSPTRPGVIYICRDDGKVEVWDFIDKNHEPSMEFTVTQVGITSLEFRNYSKMVGNVEVHQNQFLAIGSMVGTLHIVETPRNLIKPLNDEANLMELFLDREVARESYYKSRWQFHTEKLAEMERAQQDAEKQDEKTIDDQDTDYNALPEKFLKLIQKFKEDENALLEGAFDDDES
mmetsp:Transcript_9420/g.13939  ORF Transcript_9420/g.13939 Transcript_9420/m.13939 type:complete len:727 (-) Transcript_9420:520-2700(-)|eukprot:CAMPEP_0117427664 /NCGR_PEP_ID=MMETSP0758-20121206/7485_1 /TAXON_ID=63605 /ORGANISM="Percolomonas cosmopolitus, Strain AE-1 (ATCC 50343)" /LENGTH=726 /DNA_ID=CAMNT_0005213473 /DNA_START=29 /DNA_END=2209 /DNA_ORIENTATION=+